MNVQLIFLELMGKELVMTNVNGGIKKEAVLVQKGTRAGMVKILIKTGEIAKTLLKIGGNNVLPTLRHMD